MKVKNYLVNIAKKTNKRNLIIISIFAIVYLIGFLPEHFALDTYFLHSAGYNANSTVYLQAGRLVMVFFLQLMKVLHISFSLAKVISFLMAISSLIIACYILKSIIDKIKNDSIKNFLISFLIIFNIFIIELFIFTEYTGVMCFGILCATIASKKFIEYLEFNNIKHLLFAAFFMLLAMFSYQGVVSIFIAISSIFLVKYFTSIKSFLKYNIILGFTYGIPAIVDFIITRIYGSSRTTIIKNDYYQSFLNISKGLKNLLVSSSNVMPNYLFVGCLALIIIIIIISIIRSKKWKTMFLFIYCIIMTVIFTVMPQFMVATDMVWIVARSNIAIGSLIGLVILFHYLYCNDKMVLNVFMIISLIMLIMQYVGWQQIRNDHYLVNGLDNNYIQLIVYKIDNYESQTGNNVEYINFYNDNSVSYIYPNTKFYGDINLRAMSIDWVRKYAIEYYSGKKYENGKPNNEYSNYCSHKNWNYYNDEQLQFNGNTLDICIY